MGPRPTSNLAERLTDSLRPLLAAMPTASNPRGVAAVGEEIEERLRRLGFGVRRCSVPGAPDVLVATREGAGRAHVGFAGHYDVEEAGDGWSTLPFDVVPRGDRLHGRGLGDNLGPLCLRLLVLEAMAEPTPTLTFLLQGEEETGSSAAHEVYPRIELPPIDLWIEETGYFELDGTQRMLVRRSSERTRSWIDVAVQAARDRGRAVQIHDRYLRKAFGEHRCPFLTHVAGASPYLAIGPNDPASRIHQPDESLPIANLELSAHQMEVVLRAAAEER